MRERFMFLVRLRLDTTALSGLPDEGNREEVPAFSLYRDRKRVLFSCHSVDPFFRGRRFGISFTVVVAPDDRDHDHPVGLAVSSFPISRLLHFHLDLSFSIIFYLRSRTFRFCRNRRDAVADLFDRAAVH